MLLQLQCGRLPQYLPAIIHTIVIFIEKLTMLIFKTAAVRCRTFKSLKNLFQLVNMNNVSVHFKLYSRKKIFIWSPTIR